jgi:hypothetical protein
MPRWLEMIKMRNSKSLLAICREFDEEVDAPFVKMKMIAIRQAQGTMEASEKDNLSTFLA